MRVSVIVPARNAAAFLGQAVESLVATRYADLEIVVVDDASEDRTPEVARALAERYPGLVSILSRTSSRGVSGARNAGIAVARGELVAFLDADDYVLPHRFATALEVLSRRDEVHAVYELAEVRCETDAARADWAGRSPIFGITEPLTGPALVTALVGQRVWATSAVVVRRTALERTGLFDERFRLAEDCHLWFRLAAVANVVPGDLSRAVSVYRRHDRNTFRPQVGNHPPMVRAIADAYRWASAQGAASDRLHAFAAAARAYVRRSMIASIDAGRPWIAWRVLATALAGGLLSPLDDPHMVVRALWTAARGTLGPPTRSRPAPPSSARS